MVLSLAAFGFQQTTLWWHSSIKLACCQILSRFSNRIASHETHWNSFADGFCWGDTSGTTSKHVFVFSGPLFLLHLESIGYPFLQVRRTAAACIGNSLILIFISRAPVTLAPCHGLSKLKQCCSFPSAWRTSSCFPTIYGSQLWSFAGSGGRLTGAKGVNVMRLELSIESWDRDILHPVVYVAGFRLLGISSRMAFQNWELNSDSSVVPSCCQLHPRQWTAVFLEQLLLQSRVQEKWSSLK